jgi:serine/threonine-protein kinase
MEVRLVVVGGPEAGRMFSFDAADSFLVGRSPRSHLVLDPSADRFISRTHCLIDIRVPRCIVHDLGSTNGTYVNGRRVDRAEVGDGDEVRVGRTRIRVLIPAVAVTAGGPTQPSIAAPEPPQWSPATAASVDLGEGEDSAWSPPSQPTPPRLCWLCDADLGAPANADGLADALPDAVYLCGSCSGPLAARNEGPRRIGDYTVLGEIGRGGMGVVLKAVHDATRRVVAIKRMLPEVVDDEKIYRLFEREIGVQSQVIHANLVRVLDHGREPGCCYFVVEYLPGGDVAHLVNSVFNGPVDTALAIRIVAQVLDGLGALHRQGFVHRDLKPGNILMSRLPQDGYGLAKITDYGLAKSFEQAGNSLFDFTREGEAAGSLMFMPPEQILNYRFVKPPADVYAAGVTLYYMLTTCYTVDSPEWSGSPHGTSGGSRNPIEALIDDPPVPLLQRRGDLPARLAEVVDRSVQKDLGERYPTAAAFRDDLLGLARDEGLL